jgi:hypothetical protein
LKDLSHAYATYRVGEYVAFGKFMKPIAEQNVELMDELTVSGQCNQATATECVNNWIVQGMEPSQQPYMERCVKRTAGCNMHWDDLTPREQHYMAEQYDTDVDRLGRAYERVWAKTQRELEAGKRAHDRRAAAMKRDFDRTADTVARDFGCDNRCLQRCGEQDDCHCFERCSCGQGVVEVTWDVI